MTVATYEEVLALVEQLPPEDQARLAAHLVPATYHTPRRSLYGICADLGPAPSAEDIDEMRREVFATFPRDDF